MSSETPPVAVGPSPDPAEGAMDEGRRYWKAAIAHLVPEKREAAWEFYLDRLESSAAADTLGGVMLLLEAHLAFFDDLPARLGVVAQGIETALRTPVLPTGASAALAVAAAPGSKSYPLWRTFLVASLAAAIGATVTYAALSAPWHPGASVPDRRPVRSSPLLSAHANAIRIEPWNDPATHRQQGVVVSFRGVAWTERTEDGGANVYVLSHAEEIRRELEALRQTSK